MKASVKVTNELSFQVDAETEEEMFKQVARVQEIFKHESCGKCNSPRSNGQRTLSSLKSLGSPGGALFICIYINGKGLRVMIRPLSKPLQRTRRDQKNILPAGFLVRW